MDDLKRQEIYQDELFEKAELRNFFNNKTEGVCVEVGSNEPVAVESQSFHFENNLNWKCYLIEPNPKLVKKTNQLRPKTSIINCACVDKIDHDSTVTLYVPLNPDTSEEVSGHAAIQKNIDEHNYKNFEEIVVKGYSLTNILRKFNVKNIDLLSIDVEGYEYEVLRGLDFTLYHPKLILLEDKNLYLQKHKYLLSNGYKLCRRLNRNYWYVDKNIHCPNISLSEKIRLFKRIYLSIWFNKIKYSIRHKTFDPFRHI